MLTLYLFLVTLIQQVFSSDELPRYWFSTNAVVKTMHNIDFRGCYGSECVYIAPTPLQTPDKNLGLYDYSKKLWAVGTEHNNNQEITWVFSPERPVETSNSQSITPVATKPLVESVFDATPYLNRLSAPDPLVEQFVAGISAQRIRDHVNQLAFDFYTRNSLSSEAVQAAHFLELVMSQYGCQNTQLVPFRPNYSPNVICQIPGYDAAAPALVVGAHYDCRSTGVNDPTQRAPGADDNASGSAGLLDILITAADLISSNTLVFRRTIIFALFSGEEQGLIGSAVYAGQLYADGVDLIGMVGLDMIGYPQPNAPTTLYWMSRSTNQNLTNLGIELTKTYLGDGTIVAPTPACCSDQQSFHSNGYAAAAVAESLAYTNNPNYHRSTDLPDSISINHVFRTTQAAAALIATLAEPMEP